MKIHALWLDHHEDKLFRYINGARNPHGWHDQRELKSEFDNRFIEIGQLISDLIAKQPAGMVIPIPSSKPWLLELANNVSANLGPSWTVNSCLEKIDPSKKRANNIRAEYDNIRLSPGADLKCLHVVLVDDIVRTGATIASAMNAISTAQSLNKITVVSIFDLRKLVVSPPQNNSSIER